MADKSFPISLVILLATITGIFLISKRGEPTVVATNLENLPMEINGYTATEDFFSEAVYKELNADKHIYRHYRAPSGDQVDLYIGYYGTAKGGRTGHNPYACLPGAGWGIIESGKIRLKSEYYSNGTRVNYILARKGDVYETVFHWYQSAGYKILDSGIEQNLRRFLGRILHNRNDGAFVRVSSFSNMNQLVHTKSAVKSFSIQVLELLPKYWPVEK
jgi:EpsI family protein